MDVLEVIGYKQYKVLQFGMIYFYELLTCQGDIYK